MPSKSVLIDKYLKIGLDGKRVNGFITELANIRRLRFVEERYFELYLRDEEGHRSHKPVIRGIYFSGRGRWVKPWIEVTYNPKLVLTGWLRDTVQIDISGSESEVRMFNLLSDILLPGGRLMVEYSVKDHPETAKALEAGVPPILTRLGNLLWRSGFTSFKDWYFAEGWMEGNTKLQGEKPLDEEVKRRQIRKLALEVKEFINSGKAIHGLTVDAHSMYEELIMCEEKSA